MTQRRKLAVTMSTSPQDSPVESSRQGDEGAREQRGFALYVGLSERKARERGLGLVEIVDALRDEVRRATPAAESQALAVVAPLDSPDHDLDLVMQALGKQPPKRQAASTQAARVAQTPVVVDLERHRVLLDGRDIELTFKELTILESLVARAGRTLDRERLKAAIAVGGDHDINDRTIDVHIRRMRAKLGDRADLIETVHGVGYRFETRPNVEVRRAPIIRSDTAHPHEHPYADRQKRELSYDK